jgi:hypothetical protein
MDYIPSELSFSSPSTSDLLTVTKDKNGHQLISAHHDQIQ